MPPVGFEPKIPALDRAATGIGKQKSTRINKLAECYTWNIDLCPADTWTLRKVEQNTRPQVLKCRVGAGWRRSLGPLG